MPGVLIRNVEELELLDQLQAVRDLPAGGFALFAAEHLRPSVETALKRVRVDDGARILPFRQPIASARARFTALQGEWHSLLHSHSALVSREHLASWQRQTTQLQNTLSALSDRPTRDQLKTAIRQVDNLAESLPRWLRLVDNYRVSTWINRLQAISTMLRFAEFRLASGAP